MSRRLGLTTRASCLLAAGLTALLCGIVLGEIDLVRAGVLAAAVPLAAAVVVHRSRVRIANRRTVEPPQATAGHPVTVHLTVTNRSALPTGALLLEDEIPTVAGQDGAGARFVLDSLGPHEAREVSYRLPRLGRGRYRVGPLRIRLRDPFRMIDLVRSFTATTSFLVTPMVDDLPGGDVARSDDLGDGSGSHSVGAHGADDASTREYRIGDDLRKIHWRSSARAGALMVRQEERPWRSRAAVFVDLRARAHATDRRPPPDADPRDVDSLEWAVSAAASIAAQFVRGGREIELFDDTGADPVRTSSMPAISTHLAGVRAGRGPDLSVVAPALRSAAREAGLCAVLGRLDPTSLETLTAALPRGRDSNARALLLDTASWGDVTSATGAIPLDAAAGVLRAAGWRVAVVRRGTTTAEAWRALSGAAASARPNAGAAR